MDKKFLKLVNRQHPVEKEKSDEFEYQDINIRLSNREVSSDDIVVNRDERGCVVSTFIEKNSLAAFLEFKNYMESKGIKMIINEAGRTIEKQRLYRDNAEQSHGYEYAEGAVAKPHESEHHTGLAIDIGIEPIFLDKIKAPVIKKVVRRLARPLLYRYMHKKAPDFGFIFRYKQNKKHHTGYNEEPWHLRYTGKEYAKELEDEKISLEEYHAYEDYFDASYKYDETILPRKKFLRYYDKKVKKQAEKKSIENQEETTM